MRVGKYSIYLIAKRALKSKRWFMEADKKLQLRLARLGESTTRAAIAASWFDARFGLQSAFRGSEVDDSVDSAESLWKTLNVHNGLSHAGAATAVRT